MQANLTNIMGNHHSKLDVSTCHDGIMVLLEYLLTLRHIPVISINTFHSYFSANFEGPKAVFRKTEYKASLTYLYAA